MRAGAWRVRLRAAVGPDEPVEAGIPAVADVAIGSTAEVATVCDIGPEVIAFDGKLREIEVLFELEEPAFGVEFRLRSTGVRAVTALLHVDVERRDSVSAL
jgi:hypothetical protein